MSDYRGSERVGTQGLSIDQGLRAYMQRVYNYMAGGLVVTGAVAYGAYSAAVLPDGRTLTPFGQTMFHSPLPIVLMIATLGIVFALSMFLSRISAGTAQLLFWAYAALNGLTFSVLGLVYTQTSITRVFLITAATFAVTSLYGYVTKRDLSAFGSFLFMGLIGLVIASLVNIFFQSSAVTFALSVIGVLLFTGLTAYDTQSIKSTYYQSSGTLTLGHLAISGALRLYLDFINLFMSLLRLVGDRR